MQSPAAGLSNFPLRRLVPVRPARRAVIAAKRTRNLWVRAPSFPVVRPPFTVREWTSECVCTLRLPEDGCDAVQLFAVRASRYHAE